MSQHTRVVSETDTVVGSEILTTTDAEKKCADIVTGISESRLDDHIDECPDGGKRAWLVILGSYLALFATFGVVNAYGVFQSYYQTDLLTSASASTISLIGSIQLFLLYGLGPVIGRVFDAYGCNILLPVGTFITVLSLMLLSLCQHNQTYQFFLCHGVLFGLGNALVFSPALAIIAHWFSRRRAFAIGIVASGSSLGGIIFPLILQRLIPAIGFGWAVRVIAFLTLICLTVSCMTMRSRLPLRKRVSLRDAVDFGGFRHLSYCLAGIGAFLNFYALFIPYFYIEIYADYQGVPANLSNYMLVLLNAMGIPARILPGLLADRFGPLRILVPSTFLSGLMVLCLWLPSRGAIPITLFSALYGLFSGASVSLLPAYIATISPVEKYGARLGSIWMIVAVATLAGTPTAGTFVKTLDKDHFMHLIAFTGVLITLAGSAFGIALYHDWRRKETKSEMGK
ncbi:hypothetical protein JAAARDRAFT_136735 [Jaapia argillacea MUCL 33604]|uniref:Major facilitator superfamily (MFS) profile domain-containing protein n=1 Tax=Jaapia argillacea MUCL 33604 TaxID=933084 RepID=A0A067PR06_9AGAM|nr:hypothetical protein JAAARDRAFT_136735 [Jaapia argillacea MUCL 33604]